MLLRPQAQEASQEVKDRARRLRDDFPHFAETCLRIRTKAGALVPLRLNSVQVFVHGKLEEQKRKAGRVRALILKARQEGMSTYVGARFYHQVTHSFGAQVLILAHEQDASDQLFGMVERFHKHNPWDHAPRTGTANAKTLWFPDLDSGYHVATAGSKATGRSRTVRFFHGSEVAYWPSAADHMAGVIQTVPDLEGTEIILESTAAGIGGEFHERWQTSEAGGSDYIPIFCPWFWSADYQRAPPDGFELNEEEEEYARLYGLGLPQMAWRRAKMAELRDPALWAQEYPATAAEAFQATGHDSFIPSLLVLQARKRECEALGSLIVGVDPARFGDDGFAVCWRQGRKVLKVERRHKLDVVQGANWVKTIVDRDNPAKVFIDVGGCGAGVVDILRDWGGEYEKTCEGVNFGGAPQEPVKIGARGELVPGPRNRRAEMWMRSKDWLMDEGGADLPEADDALHADAVGPSYKYDARQFVVLESKEDIRKRGLRSPDGWDALALTFAAPVKATNENDASGGRWRRKRGGGLLGSLWGS